jgi:hypothetical protein
MSTSNVNSLSAGVQQLYNQGLLPSSLSTAAISKFTPNQINQLARLSVASQDINALFQTASDSTSLSTVATSNALIQEINPLSNSNANTPDPLTTAVDNALLTPGNNAASSFLPPTTTTTGSKINVLG